MARNGKVFVYLLHFDQPYKHAKHYCGSAKNFVERIARHRSDQCDVNLLRVVKAAGIGFTLSRLWIGDNKLERKLKRQGGFARKCPICKRNGSA